MKRFIVLFILLFATCVFADIDTFEGTATNTLDTYEGSTSIDTIEGQAIASGSSGTWYYGSGNAESAYTNATGYNSGVRSGDRWEPGVAVSVTKLAFYAGTTASGGATLALWINDGSDTFDQVRCGTNSSISPNSWNEVSITSYSLASDADIIVTVITENATYIGYAGVSGGYYSGGNTYSSECSVSDIAPSTDYEHAVRFLGE